MGKTLEERVRKTNLVVHEEKKKGVKGQRTVLGIKGSGGRRGKPGV